MFATNNHLCVRWPLLDGDSDLFYLQYLSLFYVKAVNLGNQTCCISAKQESVALLHVVFVCINIPFL